MCGIGEQLGHGDSDIIVTETARGLTSVSAPDLLTFARNVVGLPEMRTGHVGFVGFGATQRGDRVLLAVDTQYDRDVVEAVAAALRERGAHVDVLINDYGPDREFTYTDELRASMRR